MEWAILRVSAGYIQISDVPDPDGVANFCPLSGGIEVIGCLYFLYLRMDTGIWSFELPAPDVALQTFFDNFAHLAAY
jgi:hypothetical protein